MIRLAAALPLLLAAPAWAQDPICGGIGLVGEWVGGSEDASDLIGLEGAVALDGRVPIGGHLVRMFTLSEPGDVRIEARAVPSGDPYMTVFDAGGLEMATDDDGLGDLGALIEAPLDAGTYCLAVRSYESGVTDVAVAIGSSASAFAPPPPPRDEASVEDDGYGGPLCFEPDTPTLGDGLDAAALTSSSTATASAFDAPSYAFSLSEPTLLTVTATSETGDPVLHVVDVDGDVLAENDDFDGLDSRIDFGEALPAGEYCIQVDDLNEDDAPITVTLGAFDPAADRARRLDLAEFAPTAADGVEVAALDPLETSLFEEVSMEGAARWFRLELPEGGLVRFEVVGEGADPAVTVFDRAGRRLGENDDGPDGLDSLLHLALDAGTYTVALRLVGMDGEAGVVRLLMDRYVPAD